MATKNDNARAAELDRHLRAISELVGADDLDSARLRHRYITKGGREFFHISEDEYVRLGKALAKA